MFPKTVYLLATDGWHQRSARKNQPRELFSANLTREWSKLQISYVVFKNTWDRSFFFPPSNLSYVLVLEHVVLICPLPFKSQNENERKYLSKTAIQIKDLHLISFSAMLSAVNWSFDCCQNALLKKRNLEITLGVSSEAPSSLCLTQMFGNP